jgi:DNA-binding GntR family transcriptional regulator
MRGLRQCCEQLRKLPKNASPLEYLEIKDRFYSILLDGSGNELLAHLGRMTLRRFYQLRSLSVARTDRGDESRKEVAKLVETLVRRDEDAAARACAQHVENTARAVLNALETMSVANG